MEEASELNLLEMDEASWKEKLKDRQHGNEYIEEVEESRNKLEQYIKAIDREITKRRQVKDLLEHSKKYYDSLMEEANIVTNVSKYLKQPRKFLHTGLVFRLMSSLGTRSSPPRKR